MGVSKVEFGGDTLIDLTEDSVTPETMMKGTTAHNSAGEQIEGVFDPDIYQTKTDDTLTTTDKTIVGAINELDSKRLDKAEGINLANIEYVSADDDGIWVDGHFMASKDEGDTEIMYIPMTNQLPIVAGDNVIFTVDEENQVVKINATGGGSSVFEMPQIRFANFQDFNGAMRLTEYNPFTFTVEVTGGGELKVGDLLQICVRRKYWYKDKESESIKHKWKLRKVVQREITAEDIGKRFLSINVTLNDVESKGNWMFRNDRKTQNVDTHSYMYFRIKRVTKWSDTTGEECDAIFSNVEKVAKTYEPSINRLAIK